MNISSLESPKSTSQPQFQVGSPASDVNDLRFNRQFMKDNELLKKLKERGDRNSRIAINKMARDKQSHIDYLTPQIEERRIKNAPLKPYDWEDILQRSKMHTRQQTTKHRTFISHLGIVSKSKD